MTIGDKESLTGKLMDLAPSVIESVKEFIDKNQNDNSEEGSADNQH